MKVLQSLVFMNNLSPLNFDFTHLINTDLPIKILSYRKSLFWSWSTNLLGFSGIPKTIFRYYFSGIVEEHGLGRNTRSFLPLFPVMVVIVVRDNYVQIIRIHLLDVLLSISTESSTCKRSHLYTVSKVKVEIHCKESEGTPVILVHWFTSGYLTLGCNSWDSGFGTPLYDGGTRREEGRSMLLLDWTLCVHSCYRILYYL